MLVLSLDIDFFVDPIAHDEPIGSDDRLSDTNYSTDPDAIVTSFLEKQCLLTMDSPVPGFAIRDHDAAWDVLRFFHEQRQHCPVDLIHIDAHSDLGMGDPGYVYLLTKWLRPSPSSEPKRAWGGMNLANWLAFAAAGNLVRKIEFVPRNHPPSDLFPYYLDPPPPSVATRLVFRDVTESELSTEVNGQENPWPFLQSKKIIRSVPWKTTPMAKFKMATAPDFVIVCQSPQFTPPSADRALELALRYVAKPDFDLGLTEPAFSA